ncbi:MAG TPA: hypothetical protein VGK19_18320 [Capsulimonadaceae bacterium]
MQATIEGLTVVVTTERTPLGFTRYIVCDKDGIEIIKNDVSLETAIRLATARIRKFKLRDKE